MSRCPDPDCNAEATHIGILLPWKPGGNVQVLHECPNCDPGEGGVFLQDVEDGAAIAHKARLSLEAFEKANGQKQAKLNLEVRRCSEHGDKRNARCFVCAEANSNMGDAEGGARLA